MSTFLFNLFFLSPFSFTSSFFFLLAEWILLLEELERSHDNNVSFFTFLLFTLHTNSMDFPVNLTFN